MNQTAMLINMTVFEDHYSTEFKLCFGLVSLILSFFIIFLYWHTGTLWYMRSAIERTTFPKKKGENQNKSATRKLRTAAGLRKSCPLDSATYVPGYIVTCPSVVSLMSRLDLKQNHLFHILY